MKNFFFQNFFHKFKLDIVRNWFIVKIIWIAEKYFFGGFSKNGSKSNTSIKLEQIAQSAGVVEHTDCTSTEG